MAPSSASLPTTEASVGTRIKVFLDGLPMLTRSLFLLMSGIFAVTSLVGFPVYRACFNPVLVAVFLQVWRLFTSAFLHAGILHIVFNMMSWLQIGASLERTMGTLPLLWLILVILVVYQLLALVVAFAVFVAGSVIFLVECGVGFSGVLFGLTVVDNIISGVEQRSIFGLFNVPGKYYPIALLIALQLLVPGVSLLGHGCGMIAGFAYCKGLLRWLFPRSETLQRWEQRLSIGRWRSFIVTSTAVDTYGNLLPSSMHVPPSGSHSEPRVASAFAASPSTTATSTTAAQPLYAVAVAAAAPLAPAQAAAAGGDVREDPDNGNGLVFIPSRQGRNGYMPLPVDDDIYLPQREEELLPVTSALTAPSTLSSTTTATSVIYHPGMVSVADGGRSLSMSEAVREKALSAALARMSSSRQPTSPRP